MSWPNLAKIGRCEVAEKSCHIADKKRRASAILKIDMTSFFSAEGGPIWIKFRRLVQNDMTTAVMCGNGNQM